MITAAFLSACGFCAKPLGPGAHPSAGVFFDATGECDDRRATAVEHAVVAMLQVIQGITRGAVVRPFCMGFGVFRRAEHHYSDRDPSVEGTLHVKRSQDNISCHTCLEKGHSSIRCWIDSGAWSQSGQRGGCGSP